MGTWTTTPRTWAAAEVVTAANLNAQLKDFANAFGAWTSYTPSWTSSGTAPSLGNGTAVGAYLQVQKTVMFRATITMGSSTSYGTGTYYVSLPVTAASGIGTPNGLIAGSARLWDNSASAVAHVLLMLDTTSRVRPEWSAAAPTGAATSLSPTSPWTWATSDSITIAGTYEAA